MEGDNTYDLVTIGAGSGGVRASRFAATLHKAKVCIVELPFGYISSDEIGGAGGTCVIRGCVPKKLLVYGANCADEMADARGMGWEVSASSSWETLMDKKAKEVARLNGVYDTILKSAGVDLIEGRGRILDAHHVEVTLPGGATRTLHAKNILVATGGYATKINIPGQEHALTSDEALALPHLPKGPIVIIGAGYIALEHAGIFHGMGCEVHVMFRADLPLRGFDEECRAHVHESLAKRGIHMHAGCSPVSIVKTGEGAFSVQYTAKDGAALSLSAAMVMMATGRAPKTSNLGLENAGVQLRPDGAIKVDEFSRTNVPSIWAIGDVTNRINLTPVALMEGMAMVSTCFGGSPTQPDYLFVPSAVFCTPPLGTVGFSEEDAVKQLSGEIDVYVSKFKPMKNTLSGRDERTLMKLIVHKESSRVVGVHMVGPDSPEIIQGLAVALKCGATKEQFDSTVGVHPSAAEEFVTMRTKTRTVACTGNSKL